MLATEERARDVDKGGVLPDERVPLRADVVERAGVPAGKILAKPGMGASEKWREQMRQYRQQGQIGAFEDGNEG